MNVLHHIQSFRQAHTKEKRSETFWDIPDLGLSRIVETILEVLTSLRLSQLIYAHNRLQDVNHGALRTRSWTASSKNINESIHIRL